MDPWRAVVQELLDLRRCKLHAHLELPFVVILLAALGYIDGVIAFGEETPLDLIKLVQPDVLVKGGDWAPDQIVGADEVKSWGGSVHSIPFEVDRSTTELVNRIRFTSN